MKSFKLLFSVMLLSAFTYISAQNETKEVESGTKIQNYYIKGTVLDDNQKPIANATVSVNKKHKAVQTDQNGNFSIEILEKEVRFYNYIFISHPEFSSYQYPVAKTDLPFDKNINLSKSGKGVLSKSKEPTNKLLK